jgi:hypothetical protein
VDVEIAEIGIIFWCSLVSCCNWLLAVRVESPLLLLDWCFVFHLECRCLTEQRGHDEQGSMISEFHQSFYVFWGLKIGLTYR